MTVDTLRFGYEPDKHRVDVLLDELGHLHRILDAIQLECHTARPKELDLAERILLCIGSVT